MELFFVIILGLIIGSFLSVCIYRIPLGHVNLSDPEDNDCEQVCSAETTVKDGTTPQLTDKDIRLYYPPRSFCPICKKELRWWHNIPLLSWIILMGKCSFCQQRIPLRYPLVELTTAGFAVLSWAQHGLSLTALIIFLFASALVVITIIDYDYYIIPNVISYPGTALGLLLAAVNHFTGILRAPLVPNIWEALLGIAVGAGFLLLISELYFRVRKIEGLGMGDVKLLAMTGAFFGAPCAIYTIFIGSVLGSVIGLGLIVFCRRKMSQMLPFGPFLAAATLIYIFYVAPTQGTLFALDFFSYPTVTWQQ